MTVTRLAKGAVISAAEHDRSILSGGGFATVAALLANTLPYGWATGQVIAAGPCRYQVTSANDAHVSTAGGVHLRVLPNDAGEYPAEAFGAPISAGLWGHATIKAAIDAGIGDARPVRFGPGEWRLSQRIFINSNCIVRGSGWLTRFTAASPWTDDGWGRTHTLFHAPVGSDPGFGSSYRGYKGPYENIHFSDFYAKAPTVPAGWPGAASGNRNGNCIRFGGAITNFSVRRCHLVNGSYGAILATGYAVSMSSPHRPETQTWYNSNWAQSTNGWIEDNLFESNWTSAMLEGGVRRVTMRNNVIRHTSDGYGIRITSAEHCHVEGNLVHRLNTGGTSGIVADRCRHIHLIGNEVLGYTRCIQISHAEHSIVASNILEGYMSVWGNWAESTTTNAVYPFRHGVIANNQWIPGGTNPLIRLRKSNDQGNIGDNGHWVVSGNRMRSGGQLDVTQDTKAIVADNFAVLTSATNSNASAIKGNNVSP